MAAISVTEQLESYICIFDEMPDADYENVFVILYPVFVAVITVI